MKSFDRVYIEITNICNLSCSFCPGTQRKPERMDMKRFETVLSKVKDFAGTIFFHIMGEPLTHPLLGDFLDLCYFHGAKCALTTNGTLLLDKGSMLLEKRALKKVNISLHSYKANKARLGPQGYMKGVCSFLNSAEDAHFKTAVRLWNIGEGEEYRKNISLIAELFAALGIDADPEDAVKSPSFEILKNIFINHGSTFDWPDISIEGGDTGGFCRGLRNQIGVLVDGTVVPCCLDSEGSINLGNILKNSLDEILKGERAVRMFEAFGERRITEKLCMSCGYRRKF